jgi:hypothetical protein
LHKDTSPSLSICKPQCRKLLKWEHEWNNQVSSFRAPVERAVATLKACRILFTDNRRPLKTFKESFRAAIGLSFFKASFYIALYVSCQANPYRNIGIT